MPALGEESKSFVRRVFKRCVIVPFFLDLNEFFKLTDLSGGKWLVQMQCQHPGLGPLKEGPYLIINGSQLTECPSTRTVSSAQPPNDDWA
ncbi:hypothetical protein WN944_008828 [Citrus x changshan-huyou]|uniref:Uncharacterized protein n=1 Tax=Citrus x changshan-huyou TaxID=2935761 RepID=A0AAP0MRH2_9ROSI